MKYDKYGFFFISSRARRCVCEFCVLTDRVVSPQAHWTMMSSPTASVPSPTPPVTVLRAILSTERKTERANSSFSTAGARPVLKRRTDDLQHRVIF